MHFSRCMVSANESFPAARSITRNVAVFVEKTARSIVRLPLPLESLACTCRCSTPATADRSLVLETTCHSAEAARTSARIARSAGLSARTVFIQQCLEARVAPERVPAWIDPEQRDGDGRWMG